MNIEWQQTMISLMCPSEITDDLAKRTLNVYYVLVLILCSYDSPRDSLTAQVRYFLHIASPEWEPSIFECMIPLFLG